MSSKSSLKNRSFSLTKETILLTGGTGSFGTAFIEELLKSRTFKGTIRIFSRDEFKQHALQKKFQDDSRLRFFIGDVRDIGRLMRAMHRVNTVIHAAALKQVSILEYNPFEAVKTNILGSQNVIDSAIDQKVKRAILISSDKAVSPLNLYGATKMVAEKIFVQANSYSGGKGTIFSVARYGNVMGSRGSVVPIFWEQAKDNSLTITDDRMTRFWITLNEGVQFVIRCIGEMKGGEIFVPKIPSIKIVDLAKAIAPDAKIAITGIRPGEKIHESLISKDEARHTIEFRHHFIIEPETLPWFKRKRRIKTNNLEDDFYYASDNNSNWLSKEQLRKLLKKFITDSSYP